MHEGFFQSLISNFFLIEIRIIIELILVTLGNKPVYKEFANLNNFYFNVRCECLHYEMLPKSELKIQKAC